jgi:hypothetical protein
VLSPFDPPLELPPNDLLFRLVDVFFDTISVFFPIIHRGLLEQQLAAGFHEVDIRFQALMLGICACAARNLDDPRVQAEPGKQHSAGWMFYQQIEPLILRESLRTPDLVDLQTMMVRASLQHNASLYSRNLLIYPQLGAMYLAGTSFANLSSSLVTRGVRICLNLGAHRSRTYSSTPNLVDELWKRAFWYDQCFSPCLG